MIALCLQCCPHDLDQTFELVELICDIEPAFRKDGEFFLIYRKDCHPSIAMEFVQLASQKFARTSAREGRNFDIGWPAGSNMLAASSFIEMTLLQREGVCRHTGFLLFEPDCIPFAENWIDQLSAEWDRTSEQGLEAFGHWHQQFDESSKHMNGNAVFQVDYFNRHPCWIVGSGMMGWDYFFREQLLQISRDSNLIHQLYNQHGFTIEQFLLTTKNGVRPALLHGIKTPEGRQLARELLIPASQLPEPATA